MKLKLKRIISGAAAALLLASFCSCEYIDKAKDFFATDTQTEQNTGETEENEETRYVPTFEFFDPLTNNPVTRDLSDARPVAVMIKNDRSASPQYGLSEASVIYEAAVEGGMTRFLAVYADAKTVTEAGPVIDSRGYFYAFAADHDAVFVQVGSTTAGAEVQSKRGIIAVDATKGELLPAFRRDATLIAERGYENSIIVNGSGLSSRITALGIRTQKALGFEDTLSPIDYLDTYEMTNGRYCATVTIPFSSLLTVSFKYSTLTNSYARSQYDAEHIDAATGKQLRFTNLIIVFADFDYIDTKSGELTINETDSGVGYYVYGGSYIPIVWRRENGETPMRLYKSDGETPLEISAGNTYFGVLSTLLTGKATFK